LLEKLAQGKDKGEHAFGCRYQANGEVPAAYDTRPEFRPCGSHAHQSREEEQTSDHCEPRGEEQASEQPMMLFFEEPNARDEHQAHQDSTH